MKVYYFETSSICSAPGIHPVLHLFLCSVTETRAFDILHFNCCSGVTLEEYPWSSTQPQKTFLVGCSSFCYP